MLFKSSLLCCARLCAAPQQRCAPARAEMAMASRLRVHRHIRTHQTPLRRCHVTDCMAQPALHHQWAVAAHMPLGCSAVSERLCLCDECEAST